jgi:hypothetical protein
MFLPSMEVYINGIHKAVIESVHPLDGRVTVKELDSDAIWHGIDPKRIKLEPVVLIPLPEVEGDAPSDADVSTAKAKEALRVRSRLSDPLPVAVDQRFLEHLQRKVRIRLLYRTSVEDEVKAWFAKNGLSLPLDIRPVKSDMQGVAGSVTFPLPEDPSIIPGLNFITRGKQVEINNLSLVVSLLKLGFQINSYAKA